MKNTGGRWGGSITAAQLLARFVGKTAWAHLDIAGTALGSPQTDTNKSWSAGWGVQLLDRLVEDYYEVGDGAPMTEMRFYNLQGQARERVLPTLVERSLERGWRAVVQSSSEERVEALDAHLWTFRDDSFLPHGTHKEASAADQPILLTVKDDNPNAAAVRFLIDGAPVPADAGTYQRIVLLCDGMDEEAVADARTRWTAAKAEGFDVTYWQADQNGRWVKKA